MEAGRRALFTLQSMEYVSHINDWHWGRSIEIVAEGCIGKVDMSFEKDNPGVCYLSGLSVLPKYRRHGVATELLSICERTCSQIGVFRIDLNSVKTDFVLEFYRKRGFVEVDERDGFVRMYKFLGGDPIRAAVKDLVETLDEYLVCKKPRPMLVEALERTRKTLNIKTEKK